MRLPEKTRKQLGAGRATEIRFPVFPGKVGAIRPCPVKEGRSYPVENEEGTELGELTVMVVMRDIETAEWRVLVRPGSDRDRFPGKGGGYTEIPSLAMRRGDEPGPELPAVDRETQANLTKEANERWDEYMQKTRPDEVRERKMRVLSRKVRWVQAEAMKRGVDIAPQIEEFIEKAQGQLAEEREAA